MATFRFVDLPLDLKKHIISFIPRPTDLKALCLTSREFRELATPPLYRTIYLHVGGDQDRRLTRMINPSNPGLSHIRELYLRLEKMHVPERARYDHSDVSADEEAPTDDPKLRAPQAHFTIKLLLDFLPKDTLETFRWQSWEPLSTDNFVLLCRTQRRLKVLQIDPTNAQLDPVLAKEKGLLEEMKELTTVDIYPDSVDRLKAASRLLKAKPDIKQLSVSVWYELANEVPDELHDQSTRPGVLTKELFGHMLPFEKCEPFKLTCLELCDVSLRYCIDTWMKIIRFPTLERLEIQNCEGADVLFTNLSKEAYRPTRLRTLRWYDQDKCENHAVGAASGFLESLEGLQTIDIFLEDLGSQPRVDAIVKHKETLTTLSMHSYDRANGGTMHVYTDADFARICRECTGLRQLSIMFPGTNVKNMYPSNEFRSFLKHIRENLPELIVLNVRRWPSHPNNFSGCFHRIAQTLGLYEHDLQRLSQRIFVKADEYARDHQGCSKSKLAVVAWGPNGRSRVEPSDKFKLKQLLFVRGEKVDPFGGREFLAVQTAWNLVQFVAPESDMLNHSVGFSQSNMGFYLCVYPFL